MASTHVSQGRTLEQGPPNAQGHVLVQPTPLAPPPATPLTAASRCLLSAAWAAYQCGAAPSRPWWRCRGQGVGGRERRWVGCRRGARCRAACIAGFIALALPPMQRSAAAQRSTRSAPLGGLLIHGGGRVHKVGDIRNVHAWRQAGPEGQGSQKGRKERLGGTQQTTRETREVQSRRRSGPHKFIRPPALPPSAPSSRFPFGRRRTCRASSMSLHPGGSTLHTARWRRSVLQGWGGVDRGGQE